MNLLFRISNHTTIHTRYYSLWEKKQASKDKNLYKNARHFALFLHKLSYLYESIENKLIYPSGKNNSTRYFPFIITKDFLF